LFDRQRKRQWRRSDVLQSHTVPSGAQEIVALLLAASLLAAERARAANGEVAVLRVSFVKLLELLRPLWIVLARGEDVLEQWQKEELSRRYYEQARSCPQAVRQPVGRWPRLLENESWTGPITIQFR
jgi:hypothetical protein